MSDVAFKPKAYLKEGCPFSFKFLVFMTEARLLDAIEIVRLPEGSAELEATKRRLSENLGRSATFPTLEVEPDRYLTDSEQLIEHFAERHGVGPEGLPVLSFYEETILPQVRELHELKKNRPAARRGQ